MNAKKVTLGLLFAAALLILAVMRLGAQSAAERAVAGMASGLVLLWVIAGGGLMWRLRRQVRQRVLAMRLDWRVKFVLFATLLACLEEVVTVSMTNLAPWFGAPIGEAYITASTNYFDVILLHSVVVLIPYFIALAFLLARYDLSPFTVFIAFGAVGTLSEALFAGSGAMLLAFPFWCFVYGLMVYLPAYSLPRRRGARPARWLAQLLCAPATFLLALPMIALIAVFIEGVLGHPRIHFP
ncbi:MAG: hypothetical protein KIT46_01170 [Anaerolineales bacterium]|nr:hypothetical protein [Anaerolineales bacterium]MCW5854634.1 hypothetical protein [Anaerolineales bacterium]